MLLSRVGGGALAVVATFFLLRLIKRTREGWEAMIDRVLPAIVVIKVNFVKPFDGEQAGSSHATGFIVDAERGIILTNRHVIGTGPVRAEATFSNKENLPLTPLYRDPVHDFGFFHFDSSQLKYAGKTEAIELAPLAAKVGLDIRVVGNDAGEKVSILSGTLARLDRNAPHYQSDGYNDFNTFYYSAASNTSGGSSGSPVLDSRGRAVALNAGGSSHSSASYYLPLHAVVRALDGLKRTTTTMQKRGTIRVIWRHQTCDEMRRLALQSSTEATLREHHLKTKGTDASAGLLVVDQLVRGGTGAEAGLEVGDILVSVELEEFADFDALESSLDAKVGSTVALVVERGGETLKFDAVRVEDLHSLNPSDFLEFGGGVLHALSYGALRNGNLAQRAGVYVAFAGFVLDAAGVPAHSVVTALGERLTPTLEAFEEAARLLRDGERVTLRFFSIGDQFNEQVAMVRQNRRWFKLKKWRRTDHPLSEVLERCRSGTCDPKFTASWTSTDLLPMATEAAMTPKNVHATFHRLGIIVDSAVSCLCKVSFDVLHAVDGVHDWHFVGSGVVVDAEAGLVVVDRNTVTTSLGECSVTFAASVELPAKLVFVHPTHNFALIRYDASVFAATAADRRPTSAKLASRTNDKQLAVGEELTFVGLCRTNPDQALSQKVVVTEISCVNIAQAHVPRFRALNEEIAKFDQVVNKSLGGLLVDSNGEVAATWSCYSFYSWNDEKNYEAFHAVDVAVLAEVCAKLASSKPTLGEPVTHSIGMGLKRLPLSTARTSMKLAEEWVEKLQKRHPDRSQVLLVSQLTHDEEDSDSESEEDEEHVKEGDLILAIDDATTATFRDVEDATNSAAGVTLTVWRDGAARSVKVATEPIYRGAGTERVLVWCGLLLQIPHRAVTEMGAPRSRVYCSYYLYGSPAHFYSIKACRFIVEVNGEPVRSLDDFVRVTSGIGDGVAVRLKTSDLQGQLVAATLKTDYAFWPSHQFVFNDGDWTVREWEDLTPQGEASPTAVSKRRRRQTSQ